MKGAVPVSYTANIGKSNHQKQAIAHIMAAWEDLGRTDFQRGEALRKMLGFNTSDNRLTMDFCEDLLRFIGASDVKVGKGRLVA